MAHDPFSATRKINFDFEALALRWYESSRYETDTLRETGERLLRHAAESGHPRAELRYGLVLLKAKNYDEGRKWLNRAADKSRPPPLRIAALRALAIDSERRMHDIPEALKLAGRGLALLPPDSSRREEFERRIVRLRLK
jgi:TPR repeat protein